MKHGTAVSQGPPFSARTLFPYESVFYAKEVKREGFVIEEVAILLTKLLISIVSDLHQAICDAKGIGEIFTKLMGSDFGSPVLQVFSVEKFLPSRFISGICPSDPQDQTPKNHKFH
jgi:hypothetical protein